MKPNPDAPWRRRQQAAATKASMKKTWWQKVWASRTAWGVVGGALVWVLSNGVESLTNLRKLPPLSHLAGMAALLALAPFGFGHALSALALGVSTSAILVAVAAWEWMALRAP